VELQDLHELKPDVAISIRKVGITGVKMPIGYISFNNKPVVVVPVFNVFINLPANQKGIHASRSYEVIAEVLSEHAGRRYKLEEICAAIASELLKRHGYASRSEVQARGEAVYEKKTPRTEILTYESCHILAKAIAYREKNDSVSVKRFVGVRVTGITACPCAQEILENCSREQIATVKPLSKVEVDGILSQIPVATHMQRGYGSIIMELPKNMEVDAMRLVRVIEDSMSAPTFELLKRPDEADLVMEAANKPRFAEDCIRYMMKNFVEAFPSLPDGTSVVFSMKSKESIHKHDLVAERSITMGEMKREISELGSMAT